VGAVDSRKSLKLNVSSPARFLFCQDIYAVTALTRATFPNLIAVFDDLSEITRYPKTYHPVEVAGFALSLFKPIKSATLFGLITETPVYCFPYRRSDSYLDSSTLVPCLSPLQELRSLHREKGDGAGLLCDVNNNPSWTTRISSSEVEFGPALRNEGRDESDVDTLYELMKIASRARSRDFDRESSNDEST
jgi:hypothetical protein